MEGRAALARRLVETRAAMADTVFERLGPRSSGQASALIVRSLVCRLRPGDRSGRSGAGRVLGPHGPRRVRAARSSTSCRPTSERRGRRPANRSSWTSPRCWSSSRSSRRTSPRPSRWRPGPRARGPAAGGERHDRGRPDHAQGPRRGDLRALPRDRRVVPPALRGDGPLGRTTDVVVKAGVLHDIGKIATPDAILFKTGPLDADEWAIMQKHAEFGAEILRRAAGAGAVRADRARAPRALGRQGLSRRGSPASRFPSRPGSWRSPTRSTP